MKILHKSLMCGVVYAIALCAGCAVGPDFHRPEPPAVARYTREPVSETANAAVEHGGAQRFDADTIIDREWWTAFGSTALSDWVKVAFAHNPTIDAAVATLRGAEENLAAQRSTFFPGVQLNYNASRQKNAVGTISPTLTSGAALYTLHTAQLNIAYTADVFGQNRRTVESLAAQAEAQKYALEATYLTLASNVVAAAVLEASLRAQIDTTKDIIAAQTKSLELLRFQSKSGYASGLDVAAQESALAAAQATLPPLEKQLEQTRDLLAILAGKMPSEGNAEFNLATFRLPATLPLSLPSQLVTHRPDVRAAEAQVRSASAQVGVAVASRFPQFSVVGSYGGSSQQFSRMFADHNMFWSLAGNVAQTVFDFGALKHRQRAAEAALNQAMATYRITVLTAFQNVADTLYSINADAKTLAAAAQAEVSARNTYELTRRQHDLGFVNALAILSTQQAWQQARIARIQAEAARLADTAALFQALGGGPTSSSPAYR